MLKHFYESQESIPENQRGSYVQSGTKWVLDNLSDDHPVLAKNGELLRENSSQKGTITRLTNEKQALEGTTLAAGHVAVTTTDARLLEELKPLGTAAEIKAKVAAHDELKAKVDSREKADTLRQIAIDQGFDPDKIAALEDRFPVPSFRDVKVDGKTTKEAYFKAKDGDKEVERSFTEHLESDPKLKPLQDSLKTTSNGTRVHGSRSNNGEPAKDLPTRIREQVKQEQQHRQTEVHPMFKQIPGRVASTGE